MFQVLLYLTLKKKKKGTALLSSSMDANTKEHKQTKGMFGNCFFPLFLVFKNNFLFLRLKNLFGNSKQAENKNCFQNSICEEN